MVLLRGGVVGGNEKGEGKEPLLPPAETATHVHNEAQEPAVL